METLPKSIWSFGNWLNGICRVNCPQYRNLFLVWILRNFCLSSRFRLWIMLKAQTKPFHQIGYRNSSPKNSKCSTKALSYTATTYSLIQTIKSKYKPMILHLSLSITNLSKSSIAQPSPHKHLTLIVANLTLVKWKSLSKPWDTSTLEPKCNMISRGLLNSMS